MAEIKSVIMETLSAGQVKQQAKGSVQKNSSSNSFDNYLSSSQKSMVLQHQRLRQKLSQTM